jgi:cytochrome c-type biogenesis protein CcmH
VRRGPVVLVLSAAAALLLFAPPLEAAGAVPEEEVHHIAMELRCPVCQNLSVADSPSEMAKEMRGLIRERLEQGQTREEVMAYFVGKYGEWILLSPRATGFNLLVWILPFAAILAGLVGVLLVVRRWSARARALPVAATPAAPDPAYLERVRRDLEGTEGGLRP